MSKRRGHVLRREKSFARSDGVKALQLVQGVPRQRLEPRPLFLLLQEEAPRRAQTEGGERRKAKEAGGRLVRLFAVVSLHKPMCELVREREQSWTTALKSVDAAELARLIRQARWRILEPLVRYKVFIFHP